MKTIFATLVLVFVQIAMHAQEHDHLHELLENKSLRHFEIEMGFTENDSTPIIHASYIDSCYQAFFNELHREMESNPNYEESSARLLFEAFAQSTLSGLSNDKPAPEGGGGGPKALNGPCENMDFESGDFTGWELTRGDVDGSVPYSYINEVVAAPSAYHQIFAGGVDPIVGIPRVNPDGGGFSARLGNGTGTGARAARLRQSFLVDATNYMYQYSYAVVFESPDGHALNEQPYFTVRVFDSTGASITCGEYSVIADAASAPDYESIIVGGETVLYKDWTTVFTNLQAYIGQNVTVEFTSGDCSLTGHYGYAYVDAFCGLDSLYTLTDTICTGDSTLITAPDGLGAYLWNTGATTQSIWVYNGGNYSCELTPVQGPMCGIVLDIDIYEFPTPVADFTFPANVCLNDASSFTDLSTIAPPGTIATWQWDFGDGIVTPASSGPIVAVPNTTGTYTAPIHTYAADGVYDVKLIVTSADGCQDSITYQTTVLPLPVVGAGPDQAVCFGTAVTLTGSGASSYNWNFGVVDGVPFNQGIGTVTYTVTGTDANGCQNTDQVDVTVWNLPNVWAGADQAVCDGAAVTLSGSGAVGYAWDNGITDGVPFVQAVGTITYTVTGTDANGCQNTDQVDVTVWPLPVVGAGADQAVCDGVAVTLNGSGATNYAWDNGITDGVPFVQAVGTVTYTVIGTDANGCQNTDQVDVTVWPLPVVDAGPDQAVCFGTAVTLTGSGASSYNWNFGVVDGVPFNQGLGTVTYTVTGTDANGCQNNDQVDVTVWNLPNVWAGADQAVCDGAAVTLSGSGAVGYAWDNGITDGIPFVQAVGTITYTVTGTDANGCQNTDQVDVTVWPLPVVGAGADQAVCDGVAVTLNGSGATNYAWDNGVMDGVPFVQAVGTVTYTVIGTDANGCQNTDQVDVTVWPLPAVGAGPDQVVCEGTAVTLNGSGADAYAWNMGVVNGVPFVQAVGTVTYTVVGTDANGCQNNDQVDVTVGAYPSPNAGPDQIVCENTVLTLTSPGGPQLTWSNGIENGVPFVQAVGIQVYVVYDTTSLGCSASDTVRIEVLPNPVVTSIGAEVCPGQEVTLFGQGAVSYSWSGGILNGVPFTPNTSGFYIVTGTAANGCTANDTVWVEVYARPEASFYFTNQDLSTLDSGTDFVNTSINGSTFQWNFGDGSPYNFEFEPYHEFPFDEGDSYTVTLTITTAEGCVDEYSRVVSIEQDYNIFVPNTFTPDNNGVNEIFKPILDGFDEEGYTLLIFNRWGQLVFESHDMSVGWDGTYANRFDQVQDGVFTWKVVARVKKSAQRKEYVGHVSLLK